jgi:hypothetical protein
MRSIDDLNPNTFLTDYPGMAIRPSGNTAFRLKGKFEFSAEHPVHGKVADAYQLQINIPAGFPRELPEVMETGGRIPRLGEYHVNGDGSLCLGSHLRLLIKLNATPTLSGFATSCLIPYLYAISLKLKNGGKLVFGELAHYGPGMLQDYAQLFMLGSTDQARYALSLLGMKKRIANKQPCPCGCSVRLGRCRFNRRLLPFRKLASRGWFRRQLKLATT